MLRRRDSREYSRMGRPSISTMPGSASYTRGIRLTRVVLPDPVGPTIARLLPAGTRRFTSRRTGLPPDRKSTSELQSRRELVCRLLLEKKKKKKLQIMNNKKKKKKKKKKLKNKKKK